MLRPIPTHFGDPSPAHISAMRSPPKRFQGVLKGVAVSPPPRPDSDIVRGELLTLMRSVRSPTLDPELCEELDHDFIHHIAAAARRAGAEVAEDELTETSDELIPVILKLKYHFNFPRPWQVAPAYGINLWRLDTPSALSPSYPSGHAIQAGALCSLIAERFPQTARAMDAASTDVGISRLQLGVHFPMDVVEGLRLGRTIGRRIAV